MMKKIGIVGPESTGKTALAQALAAHFRACWEPEYARAYVQDLQRPYTQDDVCKIAEMQILIEKRRMLEAGFPYCFFDTELIITKVWFLHCYGACPDFLTAHLQQYPMDFYLLCAPDLPFVPDPLRENGDKRAYFFDWYECEIQALHVPYGIVSGSGEQRLQCAVALINEFEKSIEKK